MSLFNFLSDLLRGIKSKFLHRGSEFVIDPTSDNPRILINLRDKLDNPKQTIHDVGVFALRCIDKNFAEQGRPKKWKKSKAAEKRNGMTLVDTGALRRSVSVLGDQNNIFKTTKNSVTISSRLDYASYLHKERPFLVLTDEDMKIVDIIVQRGFQNL